MERAGKGLNEASVLGSDVLGHHVHQGSGGVEEVAGHGPLGHLVEPVDMVRDTHLVVAGLTVPQYPTKEESNSEHFLLAVSAGDDLLGHRQISDLHAVLLPGARAELHHTAGELVPGYDRWLHIARDSLAVSPEPGGSVVCLGVPSTDTNSLNLARERGHLSAHHFGTEVP